MALQSDCPNYESEQCGPLWCRLHWSWLSPQPLLTVIYWVFTIWLGVSWEQTLAPTVLPQLHVVASFLQVRRLLYSSCGLYALLVAKRSDPSLTNKQPAFEHCQLCLVPISLFGTGSIKYFLLDFTYLFSYVLNVFHVLGYLCSQACCCRQSLVSFTMRAEFLRTQTKIPDHFKRDLLLKIISMRGLLWSCW